MSQAQATDVFNCTPEQFFSIISDFNKYPEFLSEVKSCKVVDTQGERKLVEYEVNLIKKFKYRLWFDELKPTSLRWTFESGEVFKTCDGSWSLQEENGKTRATYTAGATFGVFVPKMITNSLLSLNLPNMMASYHKRVAQLFPK